MNRGCLRFDICMRKDEQPDHVFLYEVYESPEALEIHRSTEYFCSIFYRHS